MTATMIIELLIVLIALWIGARYGSLALGAISGIGLAILVFGFGMKPGTPPTDVIYIIIAAVTCAGVLQASGGMDWLIQVAERMLRKHPDRITIMAPFCTFFLTILVGTGHVVYTLMPIICDIALKKGIRPERPCGVASIASQVGITCSPIAAAVVAFTTISAENGYNVTIPQILAVTIPACIIGLLCAAAVSYHRGLDLDKDPEFQRKIKDPVQYEYIYGNTATTLGKEIPKESKRAVYIFFAALAIIVMFAIFQSILPEYDQVSAIKDAKDVMFNGVKMSPKALAKAEIVIAGATEVKAVHLKMNLVIQIVMISAAAYDYVLQG
jgi:anaerobic C4-dicarboxylate transporter DcuB